jgi:DNA-binding CsgD family transcriptional regulator
VSSEWPIAHATLEAMLGALPVPAYTNDLRGFVTWQNAAALAFGGDRRGTHYSEAVPPKELQRARETWAAVTLSGATKLEVIVAPIRVKGNVVGVFGIAIPSSDDLPRPSATEELSPRQLDVLRLLVQGKSTSHIAADLHLAPETVRNHVGSLLKTLGARSRLEATLVALRDRVVSLDLD